MGNPSVENIDNIIATIRCIVYLTSYHHCLYHHPTCIIMSWYLGTPYVNGDSIILAGRSDVLQGRKTITQAKKRLPWALCECLVYFVFS